jgi:uncharacterized protein YkwD
LNYPQIRRCWLLFVSVIALIGTMAVHTAKAEGPTATTSPQSDAAQSSASSPNATDPNTPSGDMQRQLFDRLNAIRADYGLAPFSYSTALEVAAQRHTNDMQANSWRSHRGTDGTMYYDRMVAAGYRPASRWGAANETIGWGNNLDRQITWWMNSPVHRGIILSSKYTEIGIGYGGNPAQRWGHWWTVDYGIPE